MQGMTSIARETPLGQFSSSGLTLLALLSLAQSRDSVAGLDCPSRAQGCPHPGSPNSRMATMQELLAAAEWCLSISMGAANPLPPHQQQHSTALGHVFVICTQRNWARAW